MLALVLPLSAFTTTLGVLLLALAIVLTIWLTLHIRQEVQEFGPLDEGDIFAMGLAGLCILMLYVLAAGLLFNITFA